MKGWRPLCPRYGETSCRHPAAILENAKICDWEGNACPGWPVVVDTGGDRTLIPAAAPAFLGIKLITTEPEHTVSLTLSKGVIEVYPLVYVRIFHESFGLIGPIRAACADRDSIALGRDSFQWLFLAYDGSRSRFIIRRRRKIDTFVLSFLRFCKAF